ncbi:site-specific integrase [Pseudomonas sp. B21-047]|uniref:site-specific integrase n=1 Tax=Pseudomonas sp. B21-047 TaxID=2895489 RepID=UPI00215E8446|nr:site-specific integrase [Pseudomonas sp. B21-047]UVL05978.1 site-specific integrase [Pseudomonas sp. B21-047]
MSLAGGKQLHSLLNNLILFSHDSLGKTITKDASKLPFMFWPDGSPCTQANLYMLTLLDSPGRANTPLSRHGTKGGSIGTYASQIGQLIRFCYIRKISFLQLSDGDFTDFVSQIRTERSAENITQRRKNSKTTNLTAQRCLKFLQFLGNYAGTPNFVAPSGIINICHRTYTRKLRDGKIITSTSMYHHSFSAESNEPEPRSAITDHSIKALRDAADSDSTSDFICSRRQLHISFLEYLGPRRGELNLITVSEINRAWNMQNPMLTITTLKQGAFKTREKSITKILLTQARDYIDDQRSKIIKKFTKSGKPDHDFLFISETTGKPLAETTLTNEINTLAGLAGIDEKACPHMFRHAYCENYFVCAYQKYKFISPAEFELRLRTDDSLLREMMMDTGHKSLDGLLPYVKSAYKKIHNIDESISTAKLMNYIQELKYQISRGLNMLRDGCSIEDYISATEELIHNQEADVRRICKSSE